MTYIEPDGVGGQAPEGADRILVEAAPVEVGVVAQALEQGGKEEGREGKEGREGRE